MGLAESGWVDVCFVAIRLRPTRQRVSLASRENRVARAILRRLEVLHKVLDVEGGVLEDSQCVGACHVRLAKSNLDGGVYFMGSVGAAVAEIGSQHKSRKKRRVVSSLLALAVVFCGRWKKARSARLLILVFGAARLRLPLVGGTGQGAAPKGGPAGRNKSWRDGFPLCDRCVNSSTRPEW